MTWNALSDRMLRTNLRVFGEAVMYVRDGVQTPIPRAIFDENYQVVVTTQDGGEISSDKPVISVALADLPAGEWREDDTAIVRGVTYRCIDSHKDSEGATRIILHRLP